METAGTGVRRQDFDQPVSDETVKTTWRGDGDALPARSQVTVPTWRPAWKRYGRDPLGELVAKGAPSMRGPPSAGRRGPGQRKARW